VQLAHMVYFTLKDPTEENRRHLVDQCKKYLTGHPGEAFFAAGLRTPDLARDVNDQSFHVGLHVVFESRAAHDQYQQDPRHLEFIEANKESWAEVRVFDCDVD